jgi:hypothetical protein
VLYRTDQALDLAPSGHFLSRFQPPAGKRDIKTFTAMVSKHINLSTRFACGEARASLGGSLRVRLVLCSRLSTRHSTTMSFGPMCSGRSTYHCGATCDLCLCSGERFMSRERFTMKLSKHRSQETSVFQYGDACNLCLWSGKSPSLRVAGPVFFEEALP